MNKRQTTRATKRARSADMRRAASQEAARRLEASEEALAPAIQRHAVLDASGAVLRAPRLQRDGVVFVRVSPLAWMAANIERAERGESGATFGREHAKAAQRLVIAWDAVGDGIGLGASDWGSLRGMRGSAPTTPAGHSALVAQVEQRMEIEAARTWLGALWPCVEGIALGGMSPTAWATKVGMDRKVAAGYLRAALDRLVEFYLARDRVPEARPKMRSVVVVSKEIENV